MYVISNVSNNHAHYVGLRKNKQTNKQTKTCLTEVHAALVSINYSVSCQPTKNDIISLIIVMS